MTLRDWHPGIELMLKTALYHSRARMVNSITIIPAGTIEKIAGISWLDHQWENFSAGLLSNNWFGLQLHGGTSCGDLSISW